MMSREIRVGGSYMSISSDTEAAHDGFVKFDVDTSANAIRVRRGTEGGSRSYVVTQKNGREGEAYSCGIPAEIAKLMRSGRVKKGTYKLVEDSKNVFVLA